MSTKRDLTPEERAILEKLLAQDFPGCKELRAQLETVKAEAGGSYKTGYIDLKPDLNLPKANVVERVPVEGVTSDSDGAYVSILLHVIDGYLHELEIFRFEDGQVQAMPQADKMRVEVAKAN